ncbi:hypothetical protein YB2330_004590 [Saitoella coloradoensis]
MAIDIHAFTPRVKEILKNADLSSISAKNVRKTLQKEFDVDLSKYKEPVDTIIMECYNDLVNQEPEVKEEEYDVKLEEAGESANESDSEGQRRTSRGVKDEPQGDIDADAAYAAQLQASFNSRRSTRAADGKAKPAKKKAKVKRKSKAEVSGDEDEGAAPKKKRKANPNSAFNAPMALSPTLAELVGEKECSRPQTVKKIWEYVKGSGLQDPADRRYINCDDKMKAVFKTARVHMFSMNKILSDHLSPVENVGEVKSEIKDESD